MRPETCTAPASLQRRKRPEEAWRRIWRAMSRRRRTAADVVPATMEHALQLEALGVAPRCAFAQLIDASEPYAWTSLHAGEVGAMFGVSGPVIARTGAPWLFVAPHVAMHRHIFLRESRNWLERVRAAYPELVGQIKAQDMESIRLLHWLGFALEEAVPLTKGKLYHRFTFLE